MKPSVGLTELIIIIAIMVGSLPLLYSLILVCNNTKMDYLADKTTYQVSDSVEWELITYSDGRKAYVPSTLAPIPLDYCGAQLMCVVNDDYCPEDGQIVRFSWDNNSVLTNVNDNDAMLMITGGRVANWLSDWTKQLNGDGVHVGSLNPAYLHEDLYLVWNTEAKQWMITSKFINIFE